MKSDSGPAGVDPRDVERAHLRDPHDLSHVMHRYAPAADLAGLARRFWVPVWSVPPGEEAPQKVLQYPTCLVVVSHDYARFYGVVRGLSTTTLVGRGWAVGVMLAPAAGFLLAGPVGPFTDRHVPLDEVLGAPAAGELVARVRAAMTDDPYDASAHHAATAALSGTLRRFLPVDPEGELINSVAAYVENDSGVLRVAQVCERFGLGERGLQRLVQRRLGLTPKWLIQRRRLHEAADGLRDGTASQADLAAALGYADQSHLVRDFATVTGMTPGQFAAVHRQQRDR